MNLCIPTLNRYDLLTELLISVANSNSNPINNVYIIDNGGKLNYEKLSKDTNLTNIWLHSPGKNIGVSASWNWFIKNITYPILICNDDIMFGKHDLYNLYSMYEVSNSKYEMFHAKSNVIGTLNGYSCFMPTKRLVEMVGWFDESFYPAYYEDNDYAYRMELAGARLKIVNTEITHFGSGTLASFDEKDMQKHHKNFQRLTKYYIAKWGGKPGKEKYLTPFNED